ncbi:hypothetical protein [Vibrio sp. F74]|uniref:hypothetical protein n=1 Tax=Vibrio sp. F74 TaxID=700020 RepID=UPI0035F594DF
MTLLHIQLFWVENQYKLLSLDNLPHLSERQKEELESWCKKRRKILNFEVHLQPWVKITSDGESTEVILRPNGKAYEQDMFGSQQRKGSWKIVEGFLFVVFQDGADFIEYRVIGNADSNTHSAAEYVNGKPNAYMKFIQTKPH